MLQLMLEALGGGLGAVLAARAAHDREMDENIGSLTPLGLPSGIIFDTCFNKIGTIFQQFGDHFWVDFYEFGEKKRALLRDTYLMQPGEKAELVFIANNPGAWLFHCHMLEHHAAGMGGVIYIS